ncbi:MAG: conserved membrane protein of unknown function [Promethearchaeota archaeon]|nr:MAG: conserved membrane protein of unknown function [Candidatus Lokiarchaeota archaeon]
MPSSIISHQAPGLWLKILSPQKIDGTAICISTFVVDLNVILDYFFPYLYPFSFRYISHSLLGLIIWTIPLTLVFSMMVSRYVAPLVSRIAKNNFFLFKPLRYFGFDKFDKLKLKTFNKNFFIVTSYSALIGGITHLLLDLPSHEYIELFYPWKLIKSWDFFLIILVNQEIIIGERTINVILTVYELIWVLETLVGLIISLYFLRYIKTHNLLETWYKSEELKEKEYKMEASE